MLYFMQKYKKISNKEIPYDRLMIIKKRMKNLIRKALTFYFPLLMI
jgi:hypothetical protein